MSFVKAWAKLFIAQKVLLNTHTNIKHIILTRNFAYPYVQLDISLHPSLSKRSILLVWYFSAEYALWATRNIQQRNQQWFQDRRLCSDPEVAGAIQLDVTWEKKLRGAWDLIYRIVLPNWGTESFTTTSPGPHPFCIPIVKLVNTSVPLGLSHINRQLLILTDKKSAACHWHCQTMLSGIIEKYWKAGREVAARRNMHEFQKIFVGLRSEKDALHGWCDIHKSKYDTLNHFVVSRPNFGTCVLVIPIYFFCRVLTVLLTICSC